MSFVSIARLRVRSWRHLPGFLIRDFRTARQAKLAAGSLAVSVLRDADRAFWTRTVWRDEAAMRSFLRSGSIVGLWRGSRSGAMRPRWSHWVQDANEPPSWPEAHRRLQQEGRRSRVNHPSEAQRCLGAASRGQAPDWHSRNRQRWGCRPECGWN